MTNEYDKARKSGIRAVKSAISEGKYPYLSSLDEILQYEELPQELPLGVMEIPLSLISGTKTKARAGSFANNFMPVLKQGTEFADKWESLYISQMEEGIREPVKAYCYKNRFYIEEGNKRVSVMKYIGAASLLANVVKVTVKENDEEEQAHDIEEFAFQKATGLFLPEFKRAESYVELAELYNESNSKNWSVDSINRLRASYYRFSEICSRNFTSHKIEDVNEAFLLFLRIYGVEFIDRESDRVIREKLLSIANELKLAGNPGKMLLMEEPAEGQVKQGLLDKYIKPFELFYERESKLKIAFINDKNPKTSRWTYGHSLGWKELQDHFGDRIELFIYNDCTTTESIENAVVRAELEGCKLIFTTAAHMYEVILREALAHPEIKFLNCSVNQSYSSVRTYYAKLYEAKFIMGAIAAALSSSDKIGYVADYPVYGAIANINAFAVGAQLVNPRAQIILKWASLKDTAWEQDFLSEGIEMFSAPDLKSPSEETDLFGLCRYIKEERGYEKIAMPIIDWGKYYIILVESVFNGSFNSKEMSPEGQAVNYYWGMKTGVVDVLSSKRIPYTTNKLLGILKNEISSGDITPFRGEIHSTEGMIKKAGSGILSSLEVVQMDWLNENIIGRIPLIEEFKEDAQKFLNASGVYKK